MSKETRDRIAFRMQPETRRRIEQWYAADNCQSKNEFIEKAVNFYVDYLGIQDNTTLLPMAIMSAIDGRLSRLEDYIARRDFTRCVEQDMTNGIIAEAFEMDRDDLKRRRAQSVRNVRATNGTNLPIFRVLSAAQYRFQHIAHSGASLLASMTAFPYLAIMVA